MFVCTPCSNAAHVVFICLPGMDQLQQNCGLDRESGPCSACGWPLWVEDVVWLWTHGFWRLRNCLSMKDRHGHITLQRSRLHMGPSQSSSDGCLLLHCLVPYGCNGLLKRWLLAWYHLLWSSHGSEHRASSHGFEKAGRGAGKMAQWVRVLAGQP